MCESDFYFSLNHWLYTIGPIKTIDFKGNCAEHKYVNSCPPPPPIIDLGTGLMTLVKD